MTAASERVYVVDDDTAVRKSVARLLRSAGFEALTFESPEEFLRLLPADAGGCAILDLAMPGRDGLAVQRELASRRIALPVVFLTGHGDIPKSVQAMKGGAADFLSKPVDDEVLLRAVRQAMRKGRADREARVRSAEVERRLAAQMSDDARRRLADLVIENDGAPAALRAQVEAAWRALPS